MALDRAAEARAEMTDLLKMYNPPEFVSDVNSPCLLLQTRGLLGLGLLKMTYLFYSIRN